MSNVIKHGKKWRARWTDARGKRHSKTFDSKKDAKHYILTKKKETSDIKRGLAVGYFLDKTCGDLFQYYLENVTPNKKSPKDDRSIINKHLNPFFKDILLKDIEAYLDEFKRSKQDIGVKTLHNILNLLGSILSKGKELRWLVSPPRIKKPKLKKENGYSYLKTQEEIEHFLESAYEEGIIVYTLYKVAIMTGMRAGELAGLTWDKIDFNNKIIIVAKSYDGPTKSGKIRKIPIFDNIFDDLLELKSKKYSDFVFPNRDGGMQIRSGRVFQEIFKRVLRRTGEPTPFFVRV